MNKYLSESGTEFPSLDKLLSEQDKVLLKRRIFALKRHSLPPITTHNMADDGADPILSQIRRVLVYSKAQRVPLHVRSIDVTTLAHALMRSTYSEPLPYASVTPDKAI